MLEKVMLLTMPAITLLIVSADAVVQIILGSQWTGASRIVFFLGITALFQPVLEHDGMVIFEPGSFSRDASMVHDECTDFHCVDSCRFAVGPGRGGSVSIR